jgi:protease-4
MRAKYTFLYLVLASGLIGAILLVWTISRESPVLGTRMLQRDRVALIEIHGVLTSSNDVVGRTVSSRRILKQLEKHGADDSVKALVLRINSPGGGVVASQEVFAALNRLRREEGKKIVVSMADITASGGYYIACAADRIFANPGTITGSIGVIMEFPNLEGLFGKIGVKTTTIKSGKFKDTGSVGREMTGEEQKVLQEMVDDVYQQFISAVAEGRGIPVQEVAELADGRIFSGSQAREMGLVDELGDLDDAIREAGALAGIKGKPQVLREKERRRFWGVLESRLLSLFPFHPGGGEWGRARFLYLWR